MQKQKKIRGYPRNPPQGEKKNMHFTMTLRFPEPPPRVTNGIASKAIKNPYRLRLPLGNYKRLRQAMQNLVKIIPASDPNGGFETSWDSHLLGLLGLFACWDFLGFSSVRTSGAFRLVGFLGLFAC